ncbi:MAG: hypothetical protein J3R72DRAFT_251466 [Linnemannia gamsii]|nr:MAG: hypothetical protein J3R72DRAFT_251466 [Linnemannia gamsii]
MKFLCVVLCITALTYIAVQAVPIEIPDATVQELIFVNPNNTSCTFPFRYLQEGINDLKFEFEEYDFSTIPGGSNFIANYEKLRNIVQSAVDSNMSFTTKENFANYTATLVAFKRSFHDLRSTLMSRKLSMASPTPFTPWRCTPPSTGGAPSLERNKHTDETNWIFFLVAVLFVLIVCVSRRYEL